MTDHVLNYLKDTLESDLTHVINEYEAFSGIDAFKNNSLTPAFYYEWTIQGMIYQLLSNLIGLKFNKYILMLEQPYTATDASVRSDIMWVDLENEHIGALELKSNFSYNSFLSDMQKIIIQLKAGTIAVGVMVFFTDTDDEVGDWIEAAKNADKDIKKAIQSKTLYPVGVPYER
ncbi:MAG: hypothetical protein ACN4GR_17485 [Arenicellales bacterium]